MKQALLKQIRKLKTQSKDKVSQPSHTPTKKQPKPIHQDITSSPSSLDYSSSNMSFNSYSFSQEKSQFSEEKEQLKQILKGMSFCFPVINIELSPKRVEILKKAIKKMGGKVYENTERESKVEVDYILCSRNCSEVTVKQYLKQNIQYKFIIDYNFIIDCENRKFLISPSYYELFNQESQEYCEEEPKITKKAKFQLQTDHEDAFQVKTVSTESTKPEWKLDRTKFTCQKGSSTSIFFTNNFICEELMKLQTIYENEKDIGRKIAYLKAVSAIRCLSYEIETERDVESLRGIGKKIILKIKELLKTGNIQKLQALQKSEENLACQSLTRVWGIGPSKAHELFKKGISTVQELKDHTQFLNTSQKIGLKYIEEFEERIPRDKIVKMHEFVEGVINKIGGEGLYKVEVCGSFRRGKSTCGDMDIILARKDGKMQRHFLLTLICELETSNFLTDHLSLPKHFQQGKPITYMGVCQFEEQIHHRIDIKHYPLEHYAFATLYFTGSNLFNRSMRLYARKKGYSLSDHGLTKVERHGKTKTIVEKDALMAFEERDIFQFLGLEYKSPEERNI